MKRFKILLLVLVGLILLILFAGCDDSGTGLKNTAPIADFSIIPNFGNIATQFSFDASSSHDAEDEVANLKVRWDFDNDGNFETDWTTEKTAVYKYDAEGAYKVKLEVEDSGELISSMVKDVFVNEDSAPEGMVFIVGGLFEMGDSKNEGDYYEKPVHTVNINSFYMSKYEVTQKEWKEVMGNNPSCFEGDNRPVEQVNWFDAVEYCNKLSEKEGLEKCYSGSGDAITCDFTKNGYRLPTEAEWEYAARGGLEGKRFSSGETISHSTNGDEQACYRSYWKNGVPYYSYDVSPTEGYYQGADGTIEVGSFTPNGYGLYDMAGNVWEWCWDWFDDAYYSSSPSDNPIGPSDGAYRVLRGGGWNYIAYRCRIATRHNVSSGYSDDSFGFRVVRSL